MTDATQGNRNWLDAVKPYVEKAPLAAFFLGVSSGFPFAMIGATLTTRLAQDGIDKRAVTAFTLAFLVYNLKWLWAWIVDGVRLPVIGRSPVFENVFFAFGHQHVGLTGGPRTGRIIADLVAGRTPNIDIRPFQADRF